MTKPVTTLLVLMLLAPGIAKASRETHRERRRDARRVANILARNPHGVVSIGGGELGGIRTMGNRQGTTIVVIQGCPGGPPCSGLRVMRTYEAEGGRARLTNVHVTHPSGQEDSWPRPPRVAPLPVALPPVKPRPLFEPGRKLITYSSHARPSGTEGYPSGRLYTMAPTLGDALTKQDDHLAAVLEIRHAWKVETGAVAKRE